MEGVLDLRTSFVEHKTWGEIKEALVNDFLDTMSERIAIAQTGWAVIRKSKKPLTIPCRQFFKISNCAVTFCDYIENSK